MSEEEREARYAQHTADLRERIAEDAGAMMIFLGAGLSFGVGRPLGRGGFAMQLPSVDEHRFPSWPVLIDRMKQELVAGAAGDDGGLYERFFAANDVLDAAQLYRQEVGEGRYFAFLDSQFVTRPEDAQLLTPSHAALVALPVSDIFTTNYDGLIELAYERWNGNLAVSARPSDFLANQVNHPHRHLVKLHGTIDSHPTIVLTRDDYARSRIERVEMFREFARQARFSTFLFVGFSLTDPNFNMIRDEARMVMGDQLPTSYLVQERVDALTARYLRSLGVEVVELFAWNELPMFLRDINPVASE